MKIRKLSSVRALVLVSVCSGAFALGCELIVDFDRTQIPIAAPATPDAAPEGGSPGDGGGGDVNVPDAPASTEGGPDSGAPDAPADAPADG